MEWPAATDGKFPNTALSLYNVSLFQQNFFPENHRERADIYLSIQRQLRCEQKFVFVVFLPAIDPRQTVFSATSFPFQTLDVRVGIVDSTNVWRWEWMQKVCNILYYTVIVVALLGQSVCADVSNEFIFCFSYSKRPRSDRSHEENEDEQWIRRRSGDHTHQITRSGKATDTETQGTKWGTGGQRPGDVMTR